METWIAFMSTPKWHQITTHSTEERARDHIDRVAHNQCLGIEGDDYWCNIELVKTDSGVGLEA